MKIALISNYGLGIIKFRSELIKSLVEQGHDVYVFYPVDEYSNEIKKLGASVVDIPLNRHGVNPIKELQLIKVLRSNLSKHGIDIVLSFTIKPNIYVGLFKQRNIKFIPNITGLGKMLENDTIMKEFFRKLYVSSLNKANHIFFQNVENYNFFSQNISHNESTILPGSGVNLNKYQFEPYDNLSKNKINFIFIGRLSKEKGINELLDAYDKIQRENVSLTIIGIPEDENILTRIKNNDIEYYEKLEDVRPILSKSHCTVHPSYHEGMSNVLLESAAMGKPLITSNISGCKEIVKENGFLIEPGCSESLQIAMQDFIDLNFEKKKEMGLNSRRHVEKKFDREIIIDKYLKKIGEI